MKIIDAKNAVLGRLASYAAKEALKGEDIVILNCGSIIITGNEKTIKEEFEKRRRRVGSSQKGPKYPRQAEKIVKRVIRGMLPNYREGRGRAAYKKVKCYVGMPEEFKEAKKIISGRIKKTKFSELKKFAR